MSKISRVGVRFIYVCLDKSGLFIQYQHSLPVCSEKLFFCRCFSTFTANAGNVQFEGTEATSVGAAWLVFQARSRRLVLPW